MFTVYNINWTQLASFNSLDLARAYKATDNQAVYIMFQFKPFNAPSRLLNSESRGANE